MRRGTRTNLLILLLCLSALYLYINTPSIPAATTAPPGAIQKHQRETTEESVFVNDRLFKDILGDLEGERTEAPPKPPQQQETRLLVVKEEKEKKSEEDGTEGWPSWLTLNPDIEIHEDISVEGMPEYFDLKSDLLPQFEKYHNETGEIMKERLQNIKQQCERASRYLKPRNANRFLFHFEELKVAWCPVFKAASTNWKQFFCKIYQPAVYWQHQAIKQDPYCPLEILMDHTEKRVPRDKKEEFRKNAAKAVKFITVRHPYERLVSMYTNKFEGCKTDMFSGPGGAMVQILQLYRRCDKPSLEKAMMLEAARTECLKAPSSRIIDPNNCYMQPIGATFSEVITWIVNNFHTGHFPDFHWAPMTKMCDLCITDYDMVEKFETLERDHYYILKRLGMEQQYVEIHGARANPSSRDRDTYHHVSKYLVQLNERLLWDLFAIYRDDFAMFGYTPHFRIRKNPYIEV